MPVVSSVIKEMNKNANGSEADLLVRGVFVARIMAASAPKTKKLRIITDRRTCWTLSVSISVYSLVGHTQGEWIPTLSVEKGFDMCSNGLCRTEPGNEVDDGNDPYWHCGTVVLPTLTGHRIRRVV